MRETHASTVNGFYLVALPVGDAHGPCVRFQYFRKLTCVVRIHRHQRLLPRQGKQDRLVGFCIPARLLEIVGELYLIVCKDRRIALVIRMFVCKRRK